MQKEVSAAEFASALAEIGRRPSGRRLKFLRAHYRAPGRAATATMLADVVRYHGHGGINLWYGKLASEIGAKLNRRDATLSLLVEFIEPPTITNKHWVLIMRPALAEGLKRAGWV